MLKRYWKLDTYKESWVDGLNFIFYEGNMTADNELDIKEAFQRAQKGHNNKAKLVASLKSRYNKVMSYFLCALSFCITKTLTATPIDF